MTGNVSCLSIAWTSPLALFPQPVPVVLQPWCFSCTSPTFFSLPSFPNYHRANSERSAGAKWNGHRLLAEPLWPSPQQPHPQPLWYTSHASQPYTYPTATPRKPQLPSLEGTPSTWLGQRAGNPGNVRPTFNQRPSLCLHVCSIRHWDVGMEG